MKYLYLTLLLVLTLSVKAQVSSSLETSQTAVIMDLKTGEIVASYNPYQMLTPASLTKLVTTAAALEYLGTDFTFKTVFGVGDGNLYIEGQGDPTIGSKYFPECTFSSVVSQLKGKFQPNAEYELRLREYYFEGAPYISKRLWEDMGNYYGAPYGAYNVDDNTQIVHLTSGAVGKMCRQSYWQECTAETNHQTVKHLVDDEEMDIFVKAYEGRSDSAYVYGLGISGRYVSGAIPSNVTGYQVKASIGNPKQAFVDRFLESLGGAGYVRPSKVVFDAPEFKGSYRVLLRYESPKLIDIIRVTNQKSINLFADAICFALGAEGKSGYMFHSSWDASMTRLRQYVDKVIPTEVKPVFYDGAGLSPMNAISAYQMASMLRYISQQPYYEAYRSSLAVAGRSGTLASFGKGTAIEGKVIGKSGSMTGVTAYAGYILNKYAFCIIFNHDPKQRSEQRIDMSQWLMEWAR